MRVLIYSKLTHRRNEFRSKRGSICFTALLLAFFIFFPQTVLPDEKKSVPEKYVTFYTAYGYREGQNWIVPMRIWVRDKYDEVRHLAARGARRIIRKRAGLEHLSEAQKQVYMTRAEDFVADSRSRQVVIFTFDKDPDNDTFQLKDAKGKSKTDRNGLITGNLVLPENKANRLLEAQGSELGWLTFRAVSKNHEGTGKFRLLDATGVSVISDIDDTVKVTEIPDGERTILRNTFFRDFVAAPCMAEMYRTFDQKVAFHYVSGSPWQLYRPLANFLFSQPVGFPEGSVQMKNIRINPFESESYQDLWKLIRDGSKQTTFDQKMNQIGTIIAHFPGRRYILIGDSGEQDPEVFRAIKHRFPKQIIEMRIRDIMNDSVHHPDRLENMHIIPPRFENGVSCGDYIGNLEFEILLNSDRNPAPPHHH